MMENMEFEEKVDIADLVLPSKPMKLEEIEINDIKQNHLKKKNHMWLLNQIMMQEIMLNGKWKKTF